MSKQAEVLTGPKCHQEAQHRARFGHRDWVVWVDDQENKFAARLTFATLKQAMLANGTQRRDYWIYMASNGHCWGMSWPLAINFLANLKRGYC